MQITASGQVELRLKTPWRDGSRHLVMSPIQSLSGWPRWSCSRGCLADDCFMAFYLSNRVPGLGRGLPANQTIPLP